MLLCFFLQKDVTFIMNRTVEGWRTWYTAPMPNIGLFLCRGNPRTVRVFEIAWREYSVRGRGTAAAAAIMCVCLFFG